MQSALTQLRLFINKGPWSAIPCATALVGGAVAAADCGGHSNSAGPGPSPNEYTINLTVKNTFNDDPISNFSYNVCTGDKTSATGAVNERVPAGDCTWRFWGESIEIPREVYLKVDDNIATDIRVIQARTYFPVEHYRNIIGLYTPHVSENNAASRMMTRIINVYSVANARNGDVERAVPVLTELTNLNQQFQVTPSYLGVVDEIPANPQDGSVYVKTVSSLPGGGAARPIIHQTGKIVNWCEVEALPGVGEYGIRHELARCLGFFGNRADDRTSLFNIYGNPPNPSYNDRMSATLLLGRPPNHYLDGNKDRSPLR